MIGFPQKENAFLCKQLLSASNISPSSPVFSLCDALNGN
jgi:hypothetical protein